ncbi:GNAT family N-acetyltransferase [Halobacterium bonnevillei]|uniref:GNAT family N-acetyltransferase n=1 Tax=Halobacterium bonnevillei TaxID=2692200 RepID=A0A6B0SDH6_9EURY|nr:GNAT family N-acetyltransferase [Halobacterium bonnevillei]MXR19795.1 GNAT family N-acetyltransferase [Halobacterium bonnevillei]
MVAVRRVPESDFDAVYQLLCERVGHRDRATVRTWYDDRPELFHAAYEDSAGGGDAADGLREGGAAADVVGIAIGRERGDDHVELAGIGVREADTRRGIGSQLLSAFETAAADAGFGRVSLGSAGGYVDDFYLANGYDPESILVRLHPDDVTENVRDLGFDILRERREDETRKFYVAPGGYDPERVEAVRSAFGDPQAIYVMEKRI